MKAKRLKTGRLMLMPNFTRRLKSFRLQCPDIDNPHTFFVSEYFNQLNRLSQLIEGATKEIKPPVFRG